MAEPRAGGAAVAPLGRRGSTGGRPGRPSRPRGSAAGRTSRAHAAFVAPAVLSVVVLGAYPLGFTLLAAFSDSSLGRVFREWVGLDNLAAVLTDPDVLAGLVRTVAYALAVTAVSTVLGVAGALALHHAVRERSAVRVLVLLPLLVPPVIVGTIAKLVVNPGGGLLATLGAAAGIPRDSFAPLADPALALATIAIADVWEWTPLVTLLVAAALLGQDRSVVEAARLDGADGWRLLRGITLPQVSGVIAAAAFIRLVLAFKVFDLVFTMTSGGPGQSTTTTSYAIYQAALREFDVGRAAALTLVLAVVVTAVTVPAAILTRRLQRHAG